MATLTSNMVPQAHHFSRQNIEGAESSMDSNDVSNYDRESLNIDNNSCCSDDTVLSVGNENPNQTDTLSFKNIESHLNAISKITNSTLDPERKSPSSPLSHRLSSSPVSVKSVSDSPSFLYKGGSDYGEKSNPTSPASFRQNLCSPMSPGSQRLYTSGPDSPESLNRSPKPQESQNFYHQQNGTKANTNNNDATSGNLKFSIDNILKADFGRRITDPINIRKSKPKKNTAETTRSLEELKTGPVDLSKPEEKSSKTETSGKQPMLWPAWVYCTRYSDRPSSGK